MAPENEPSINRRKFWEQQQTFSNPEVMQAFDKDVAGKKGETRIDSMRKSFLEYAQNTISSDRRIPDIDDPLLLVVDDLLHESFRIWGMIEAKNRATTH